MDPTAIPPVPAVLAVAAVPEQIIFSSPYNMLETYSSDNLEMTLLNALITWGNDLFTKDTPQVISEMTIANGLASTPTNLKPSKPDGENLQMARLQSKFLANQLLESHSPTTLQSIEQFSQLYTWTNLDGKDEEMDGLTVLALVINHIRPHYKVNMYLEIEKVKPVTVDQHKNSIEAFFDTLRQHTSLSEEPFWHILTTNSFATSSSNSKASSFRLHFVWNLSAPKLDGLQIVCTTLRNAR